MYLGGKDFTFPAELLMGPRNTDLGRVEGKDWCISWLQPQGMVESVDRLSSVETTLGYVSLPAGARTSLRYHRCRQLTDHDALQNSVDEVSSSRLRHNSGQIANWCSPQLGDA